MTTDLMKLLVQTKNFSLKAAIFSLTAIISKINKFQLLPKLSLVVEQILTQLLFVLFNTDNDTYKKINTLFTLPKFSEQSGFIKLKFEELSQQFTSEEYVALG